MSGVDVDGSSCPALDRLFLLVAVIVLVLCRRRLRGLGLTGVAVIGGLGTFINVGTAVGLSRFFKAFINMIGSKCSEHMLQFLFMYSGDLFERSSRRTLIAHLFVLQCKYEQSLCCKSFVSSCSYSQNANMAL